MLAQAGFAAAFFVAFFLGYVFGWASGRSSGKVEALEAVHDIDLSGGED